MIGFFPSLALALYVGRTFLWRCLAMLAMLVLVLQMLDLLSEAGNVLAYPGNGDAELWRYVSLRMPQIISRFLPFSVLLGTLVTLATLNANSEVVAMKSGGLSAHQILAPLMIVSLFTAIISFVFNERVVVRATATMTAWENAHFGPIPPLKGGKANVWVRDGDDLVRAGLINGTGANVTLSDVSIYDRHATSWSRVIHAPSGRYAGQGLGPEERDPPSTWRAGAAGRSATSIIGDEIRPDQFTLSSVIPMRSRSGTERGDPDAARGGRPVASLEGSLWHKITEPLSSLLMPLLGSVAAFGIARSGRCSCAR